MNRLTLPGGSRRTPIRRIYYKNPFLFDSEVDEETTEKKYNEKKLECDQYNKLADLEDIEDEFEIDNLDDLRDRLTKYKFLANHGMSCVDVEAYNLMLKDLEEYHKLEEELGIDLVTLLKALKYGVYCKNRKGIMYTNRVHIGRNWIDCLFISTQTRTTTHRTKQLKDYGRTWALTEAELETKKDAE